MDRRLDPVVGAAAADVAGHGRLDLLVAGRGVALQQRRGRHDLPALAVAALRHADVQPGLLDDFADLVGVQVVDGGDLPALRQAHRRDAGTGGLAVDMDGAGAAQAHAAAELGPGIADDVADSPEQGHILGDIELMILAIEVQGNHRCTPFLVSGYGVARRLRRPPWARRVSHRTEGRLLARGLRRITWQN